MIVNLIYNCLPVYFSIVPPPTLGAGANDYVAKLQRTFPGFRRKLNFNISIHTISHTFTNIGLLVKRLFGNDLVGRSVILIDDVS